MFIYESLHYPIAMEAQTVTGDEPYFSGVWYNSEIGEFEQYGRNNEQIIIKSLDGTVLEKMEYLETGGLIKVDELAVSDPVEYYNQIVDELTTAMMSMNGADFLSYGEEVSFRYARERIKVVEDTE